MFDHFVGLALKELIVTCHSYFRISFEFVINNVILSYFNFLVAQHVNLYWGTIWSCQTGLDLKLSNQFRFAGLNYLNQLVVHCNVQQPWLVVYCNVQQPWLVAHCNVQQPWLVVHCNVQQPWLVVHCNVQQAALVSGALQRAAALVRTKFFTDT